MAGDYKVTHVTLEDGDVVPSMSLEDHAAMMKAKAARERAERANAKRRVERSRMALEDMVEEREKRRQYHKVRAVEETPEEANARRAADAARHRRAYHGATPEEKEEMRELRRQRRIAQLNSETPEQVEARRAANRARVAAHRARRRAQSSTPEELVPSAWVDPRGNLTE